MLLMMQTTSKDDIYYSTIGQEQVAQAQQLNNSVISTPRQNSKVFNFNATCLL